MIFRPTSLGKSLYLLSLYITVVLPVAQAQPQPQLAFLRRDLIVPGTFGGFELRIPTAEVAVGDFNGDGRPDLVVSGLNGISVLLNLGGGQFGPPIVNPYRSCGKLIPGDFDGDGEVDLLATRPCDFSGAFLAGRGNGTFKPPRDVPGMGLGAVGDLNNDGKLDLVVNDGNTGSLNARLGNGDGTFREAMRIGAGPTNGGQIAIADFNRDGFADVAADDGRATTVYLGRGGGTFRLASTNVASTNGSNPFHRLLVADVDGDGWPDLIAGFEIFLGMGDGTFAAPFQYSSEGLSGIGSPVPLAVADFAGDGRRGLAVGSGGYQDDVNNRILIFRIPAYGDVAEIAEVTVGWQPYVGAVADMDGDGRPDLAIGNLSSNTVSLLLSRNASDSRQVRAVSAAGGAAVVAPGSLATLYAPIVAAGAAQAGPAAWPTRLGGISLEVRDSRGGTVLAPLLYVSKTQVNFLVPDSVALGEAELAIVSDTGPSPAGTMQVAAVAAGMLMVSAEDLLPAGTNVLVESDGSQSFHPLFQCTSADSCVGLPARRYASGSYLVFYGTGFRNASVANVTCILNGVPLRLQYAGPQGTPGVEQINLELPGLEGEFWDTSPVSLELVCSIDGVLANRVLVSFIPPSTE